MKALRTEPTCLWSVEGTMKMGQILVLNWLFPYMTRLARHSYHQHPYPWISVQVPEPTFAGSWLCSLLAHNIVTLTPEKDHVPP